MPKTTIEYSDEEAAAITWDRLRINAHPGRGEPIETDEEYVQIECGHVLRQLVERAKAGRLSDAIEAMKSGDASAMMEIAPVMAEERRKKLAEEAAAEKVRVEAEQAKAAALAALEPKEREGE